VNNNEVPSDPVVGEFRPQPFGGFVGNQGGGIGVFEIPSLPGGETYTVINEVPLDDLPPSARRLLPWEGEVGCPIDDFWSGGVEASWTGDAGGLEAVHRGSLLVCPMEGCSYIRVLADCPDGAYWEFQDVCPGFETGLVDNDFNEAPNPLPPGRFEGWICVDGDRELNFGETCAFDLVFACGDETAPLHMTVLTCDCSRATAVEPSTWGAIKQRLRLSR
jgi:hypothetical protein